MATEKIIVIGSNSFSGSQFIDYANGEGVRVTGISRSPEPHGVFLPFKRQEWKDYRFHQLDLNLDLEKIIAVIKDFQPDYVVNFAAQSMVAESWRNPEHWFQTNVISQVKLHDQLRRCQFLKKYVHVSTPEVYGCCKGFITENTNYSPSTPYAVSRAAADLSLMSFLKAYNFPVVFTRAANVFGPGQQLYRIIPRTILFFSLGRKLQLQGGGHSVRSFIHIRDVADGTLRSARKGEPGEIFHFSTLRSISIREVVEMIAKKMNISFNDGVEIVGERLGKDSAYLLDSTRAKERLGWKDRISLEEGIDETIKWVKDNIDELKKQPFDYIHKP
ncbi:MAG: GDP-mannose 4,6-dehydratase [Candidatus Ozemobacteraceae bacterium]